MDNVETMIAIHYAVIEGKPLMERIVTKSGDDIEHPGNFKVLLGTSHRELVEAAGGFKEDPEKLISGGPMMGFAMVTLDAPVTKTSSSILAFKEDIVAKSPATACINCGRCVEVCPAVSFLPDWQTMPRGWMEGSFFYRHECIGMCRVRFLQLCLSCKKAVETGDWFHAENCTGK